MILIVDAFGPEGCNLFILFIYYFFLNAVVISFSLI